MKDWGGKEKERGAPALKKQRKGRWLFWAVKEMTGKVLLMSSWAFIIVLSIPHMADSIDGSRDEYFVKAAFIYNFAKFTRWPEDAFADDTSPIIFCILGDDSFGEALSTIEGKKVHGRDFFIRKLKGAGDAMVCHLLYIAPSESARVEDIVDTLKEHPVMTVGDMDGFSEKGGMVNLVKVDNKVRFQINLKAAEQSGLTFSSKLLKLSIRIY